MKCLFIPNQGHVEVDIGAPANHQKRAPRPKKNKNTVQS